MSTKRRKISSGNGAIKEASIQIQKPKTKPQPATTPIEAAPTANSEPESETIDSASGEGNEEPAPKTFRDLVRNLDHSKFEDSD
jgi:hypothetical protein